MQIEVLTTKKKLTKSMVKQLKNADLKDMQHFLDSENDGYYIKDLGPKYTNKVAIFKGVNEWCMLDCRNWEVSVNEKKIYSTFKGYSRQMEFETNTQRNKWIGTYNEVVANCSKNHLIL